MAYDYLFHKNYRLLLKFKRKFGTTSIPSRPGKKWLDKLREKEISELQRIGRFVESLRRQFKKGKLSNYKIDMLNHIEFEWIPSSLEANNKRWEDNINRLKKFKEKYGHCNVPERWQEDTKLADFVVSCRICYKRDKLRKFKVITLNEIGFEWKHINMNRLRDHRGKYIDNLKKSK